MTRLEFMDDVLSEVLEAVRDKFAVKNGSYGSDRDVFHNFNSTAKRIFDEDDLETAFQVLMVYLDKHLVALANRGMTDAEYEERWMDVIVYGMLAIGMGREREKMLNWLEGVE